MSAAAIAASRGGTDPVSEVPAGLRAREDALLARARAGDEAAFAELAGRFRRELQVHCYRIVGSLQDAEDIVQETLLAAWRGLEGSEGRASMRTWLCTIATNRFLNALRARGRRMPEPPSQRKRNRGDHRLSRHQRLSSFRPAQDAPGLGGVALDEGLDEFILRVGPDDAERALESAHVRPMDFTGRPMRGFVTVEPGGFAGERLRRWVERTAAYATAEAEGG